MQIYTFLFIIFFGLVQGCSSFSEVEVKRYEDYFPSKSSSTYSQTSSTENYEVYTVNGMKVAANASQEPGIYVVRSGNRSAKVMVK